jgi:electron transfer flavoprotein alpha subunit
MAAGSDRGSEVMAHIAARTNLPLAANCTEVRPGDPYLVTRLRWGGSLLEEARLKGAVKLLTVAPHALAAEAATAPVEWTLNVVTPALADKDFRVRVTGRVEAGRGKVSLADAKVVVGGGRGVGSADGFQILEELAALLGGTVGCSRAVTSLGWRPHSDQVGQTGTRIAPEIYIACGVSGAIQHMVGAKGAKHILAINTDPEAPIVTQADYAIIGDLLQVVPALSAEIRKTRDA